MTTKVSRFGSDTRGNVAMLFAMAALPLFGMIGAAVDYTRASRTTAQIQAALDAASLAVAKDSRRLSDAALQDAANKAFAGNFTSPADLSLGTLQVLRTGNTIRLAVDGSLKTTIAATMGVSTMPIGVASQASWNEPKIEITLVLDNTGSMGWSGKMAALKTAALDLIADLEANRVSSDQVKIAVVPFDTQVNIGTGYRNESWIRFDGTAIATSLVTTRTDWTGCLTDRDQPADTTDVAPTSDPTRYRAAKCATGLLAAVQPLSTNFTLARATIAAMQPAGNTNITIGLQTGLAVASPGAPFAQSETTPDVLRYMILLTDGDNTQNRWTGTTSSIDARTALACNAVKAAGVTLFTVRVIEGNAALLRACATDPSMYFNVTNSGGIGDAFKAITSMIKRMRLSA
ncbi:vWA domain-containing protein [Phreatobacter oligotrophus]|jgi:Flp pilus assembly protein TadG|uniref:Flp pilus assembly protein TadG n=1 Tax=Phreatobacter oligotrophus TaxID=1122261 RepID=A0A2T4YZG9_9HYPH|nr:pilus assembly protein [Phreatobacter oligotrophus]PTM52299.1 Flp pilus assembly protein TadG [Phreatobacter oligotrophus]